jgi:hypothetical protein
MGGQQFGRSGIGGKDESQPLARADLSGEIDVVVEHHSDDGVTAGQGVIGQKEHGLSAGRDLNGTER